MTFPSGDLPVLSLAPTLAGWTVMHCFLLYCSPVWHAFSTYPLSYFTPRLDVLLLWHIGLVLDEILWPLPTRLYVKPVSYGSDDLPLLSFPILLAFLLLGLSYCHWQKKVWCQCTEEFCLCSLSTHLLLITDLDAPVSQSIKIFLLCTTVWKSAVLLSFIWICVILLGASLSSQKSESYNESCRSLTSVWIVFLVFLFPYIIFNGITFHSLGFWQYIVTCINTCTKHLMYEFFCLFTLLWGYTRGLGLCCPEISGLWIWS